MSFYNNEGQEGKKGPVLRMTPVGEGRIEVKGEGG
jgi:hypothetical protein